MPSLSAAHVGSRGEAAAVLETKDAALAARIEVAAHTVADLDRHVGQIDAAVEEAAKRGKTNTALSAMEGQRRARARLASERNVAIAVTSIRANAWFGRSLTTDATAGEIFSHLIPTATRFYWQDGDRRTALKGVALMCLALTVVFFAASGFVLTNVSAGTELRGERVTPAVALAERTVNTLAKSREDECRKRGDQCRDLEAQERKALADQAAARAEVRAMADPQAQALHVDAATLHGVQAAAMVGVCLAAGYIIAFGAGLIWPRG